MSQRLEVPSSIIDERSKFTEKDLTRVRSDESNEFRKRLEQVQLCTRHGWRVLDTCGISRSSPRSATCHRGSDCDSPGKHPLAIDWKRKASANLSSIERTWKRKGTLPNFGIATGKASGVSVIDIDPRHGGAASWQRLLDQYPELARTPTCDTGGGGNHYFYRYDARVPTSAGRIDGLDIRNDGAFVVAAGSMHMSGDSYRWARGLGPDDLSTAVLPEDVVLILAARRKPRSAGDKNLVCEGRRHDFLVREGVCFRKNGGEREAVLPMLIESNVRQCSPPLADDEVREIASWIEKVGDQPGSISECRISEKCIYGRKGELLANFSAWIKTSVVVTDGTNSTNHYELVGVLENGRALPAVMVPASQFSEMSWVNERWGPEAIIAAGLAVKDRVRVAIQQHRCEDRVKELMAGHLGWSTEAGAPLYVQPRRSIGASEEDCQRLRCRPDLGLDLYDIPTPLAGNLLPPYVQASLSALDEPGMAHSVTAVLWACMYRAPLAHWEKPNYSVHLFGVTGCKKSSAIAVAMTHYGPSFKADALTDNFSSTANFIERGLFLAKDSPYVVDDFAPASTIAESHGLRQTAARIFRAQGNGAARGRLDGSYKREIPSRPRGLTISSGEDLPLGQSILGRMLVVEMRRTDVDDAALGRLQQLGSQGTYAHAMAGYIRWLARRFERLEAEIRTRRGVLLNRARSMELAHARHPDMAADLQLGVEMFLAFAESINAVTPARRQELGARWWNLLVGVARCQQEYQTQSNPARLFVSHLQAALSAERCHLVAQDGACPELDSAALGWRSSKGCGERIGWATPDGLYLIPEAAEQAAQEMTSETERSTVSATTLRKQLRDQRFLASTDSARGKIPIRKTFEGAERTVLHFRRDALIASGSEAARPVRPVRPAAKGGGQGT